MRTAFINQLIEEARKNDKVFLIVGDLGYSVVEPFVQQFPDRYLNVGVAEQNMAGFAAGLALEGYCVYIYSIGNFPTLRCMEQIRYDICYHNLNVKIVAVGGGYSYGALGPSHHATEEIGMLRTIPNMVVCAPGDPLESKKITTFCTTHKGPCYVRLGKAGEPVVHTDLRELTIGDIIEVKKGETTAILSTGSMLKYVCDFVNDNHLNSAIYSFPFIKPINKSQLKEIFLNHRSIITIEEHQAQGGFGSAILELGNDLLNEGCIAVLPKIRRIAIDDKFYSIAGSQQYLREVAGIVLEKDFFQ
ncbi:transketolase C-terminal domain-containing protein [Segetibacter sp.]|jgi:transketolase|uniref:transketolase family protein n=1 Tax=Segetibacter sp. TaxID=2231182 RepID=UPI002611E90B|nr:transketolase C-terminal domain-containing protein [Segetibacter sp.]MCW3079343.1 transketolase [Segetibacter sp.]